MKRLLASFGVAATAAALCAAAVLATAARAQAPAPQAAPLLEVGALAPDFTLAGATRYGVLQQPVRLSDYRGKTVVVAFFYRVRTPG
jgi:cytochrome oxidase Cu insertion factor (SCO1/SenC/PrrC family)